MTTEPRTVLVNLDDWNRPALAGPAWLVFNAPRPLTTGALGPLWEGDFRHGILYAALPATPAAGDAALHAKVLRLLAADDAWPVRFTTNRAIAAAADAKVRQHGYDGLAAAYADGITVEELAASPLEMPWHEGRPLTAASLAAALDALGVRALSAQGQDGAGTITGRLPDGRTLTVTGPFKVPATRHDVITGPLRAEISADGGEPGVYEPVTTAALLAIIELEADGGSAL
jgi:hypothetical protein